MRLTVIRLNKSYGNTAGIRDDSRHVHRECMHPLAVNAKHVHDQIASTLGAIYGSTLPVCGEVSIMVGVSMTDEGA